MRARPLLHLHRYPVILSFEDHCNLDGQRRIAQCLRDILGELLLKEKVSPTETQLPSPHALRRKIIVKHKKLKPDNEDRMSVVLGGRSMSGDEGAYACARAHLRAGPLESDGSDESLQEVKRGLLKLYHESEKRWLSHMLILGPHKLSWSVRDVDDASMTRATTSSGDEVGAHTTHSAHIVA
jgi:hypothetical protein